MKKTILTLSILTVIFFLSHSSQAQTAEVVYLRIIENYLGSPTSFMQVTYSSGKNERIELEKLKSNGEGAVTNGVIITKQIKELLDLGYSLESQSTGGMQIVHTMMVFTKEEE